MAALACVAGTDATAEDTPSQVPDLGTRGLLTQTVELLAFFLGIFVRGTLQSKLTCPLELEAEGFLSRLFLLKEPGWTGDKQLFGLSSNEENFFLGDRGKNSYKAFSFSAEIWNKLKQLSAG